ncbi:MAG TPA: CpsD/CapB family tyrosine-protein kinase [Acidobacteriaceae bacterium]|nr:CpsD/CapB family tyrosine-protein kinase [Acidobacteriaceae bacterium]
MSRIYEALQRAEAERRAEQTDPDGRVATSTPEPLNGAAAAPFSAAVPLSSAPSALPLRSSISAVAVAEPETEVEEVVPSAPPLWNSIRQCTWKVAVHRFPSLEQRGASVEQFRSLRSRVQEFRAMNRLQSILVSSGLPQEGKSYIAANLALSLALHKNSKVLLVDGDMRRSTLQDYFGCDSGPGLADYLAGKSELPAIMQRASPDSTPAQTIPLISNLVLIPGGNGGDKAADLAGSSRFEEMLKRVSPYFDWIIVDSSPVLAVSDSVSMGRACDAVLLVARSGVTTFPVAQRAQHELKASNIIGFVLNGVKDPPTPDSYYTYDGPAR